MARRVAAVLAACLATGCVSTRVHFPNATPNKPLEIQGWLSRPRGHGPFPAVVLLHGCHGVSDSTHAWAHWLRGQGYVALIVDSWAPRGMTEGCTPQSFDVPNTERLDDGVGALAFLYRLPFVDRERVGVIGWSNGGVFAIALVNGPTWERARRRGVGIPPPGYRAAVALYPGGCPSLIKEKVERPLLVLIGTADDWTRPGPCAEMAEAMRQRGAEVSIVLYPDAVHYFDVEGQSRMRLHDVVNDNVPGGCCGATVGYDPRAAADARRRVAEFFGYYLLRSTRDSLPSQASPTQPEPLGPGKPAHE